HDADVAVHRHITTDADRMAAARGDDQLLDRYYTELSSFRVQVVRHRATRLCLRSDVATRAEGTSVRVENYNVRLRIVIELAERRIQLVMELGRNRVQFLGSVQRDSRHWTVPPEKDQWFFAHLALLSIDRTYSLDFLRPSRWADKWPGSKGSAQSSAPFFRNSS